MAPAPVLAQPLLAVRDVAASSVWYRQLLGATSGHGGTEYEQLLVDGDVVLQLHDLAVDHHHGALGDVLAPRGDGVLVWFAVAGFDDAAQRARGLGATIVHDVHVNPNAAQRELWLRDPDGYAVVLAEQRAQTS